ncbi:MULTISPECIES: TetR family transcriptional regulator [unclassified Microbacterium]|uniref:TetR family transcriptional regulator n=1 Tax=unclassified Microbacterium TaxID=2609290 RepID=UPI00214C5216|nr:MULTISPECIES: TetR family transcriptional regulator [unclassified Microbacterium]MCR2809385.1 TetR family transcriptional regulator [Microbacterium sp. zg.B185]WIM20523.1 TetR family transcriptional regulator [Microbacterium sp. zg-B185]
MNADSRTGRPRASSRETLAEAACELFLEQGYDATSIADIAQRAGVSRSSFFNYFASKGDILWSGLDERVAQLQVRLAEDQTADAAADARAATAAIAADFAPDSLALALVNADAMGLADELEREASLRRSRIARTVSDRLRRSGADRLHAEVLGAAFGGAVLAALHVWADDGAGRTPLPRILAAALDAVRGVTAGAPGTVRQLRVVVEAADYDSALRFYRDEVGMPEREAYQGDGDARVVILGAGEATLELANAAQVSLIDRVETDGGSSDRVRLALEVEDTAATVERLVRAGARVEASARETPWRSVNARLRGPADLQITIFQELGEDRTAGRLA